MAQRFTFQYNPKSRVTLTRKSDQHSTSVASHLQVNTWYGNIKNFIEEQDQRQPLAASVTKTVELYYRNVVTAFTNEYNTPPGAGAGGAGHVPQPVVQPGQPLGGVILTQETMNNIYNTVNAVDQAWHAANDQLGQPAQVAAHGVAAAGGPPAVVIAPNFDVGNPFDNTISEEDFMNIHWQILEAMAHSGFTGVGDYEQDISYYIHGEPDETYLLTLRLGDIVNACLPAGVTPFNIGAAHADQIARTAKEQDIVFEWGTKHGCPRALNHLGFSTWKYIKDKTLLTDQFIQIMEQVSANAIRDSAQFEVIDPLVPNTTIDNSRKAAANSTLMYNQNRARHSYKPSDFTGEALKNFRFGGGSNQ